MTSFPFLLAMCARRILSVSGVDAGFNLVFSSNDEEVENAQIKYSPLLPFSLTGTYVGINILKRY